MKKPRLSSQERAARQAEWDADQQRMLDALPQAIRDQIAAKTAEADVPPQGTPAELEAKAAELKARRDELEEISRTLEADIAEVTAENKKFREMQVLFEKGGFEAVIASKDEQIRVIKTRIYGETQDAEAWRRSARYWEREARRLGFRDKPPAGGAA